MFSDVADISGFYRTPLGLVVARILSARIAETWEDVRDLRVLMVGYGIPCAEAISPTAERVIALMPANAGAVRWPKNGPSRTLLANSDSFPLDDGLFDRVLLLHALERAESPGRLLRETWRVMAPGGRMLAIVPNRWGIWNRFGRTPFGAENSWGAGPLQHLLHSSAFDVRSASGLLHAPPLPGDTYARIAPVWERISRKCRSPLGSLVAAEASKQIHSASTQATLVRTIRKEVHPLATGPARSTYPLARARTRPVRPLDQKSDPCCEFAAPARTWKLPSPLQP